MVVSFTWSNSVNFCVVCHIYLCYFANSRKDKHRKFTPTPKNISLEALLRLKHSLFSYIIYLYLKSNKILKVDPELVHFLNRKLFMCPDTTDSKTNALETQFQFILSILEPTLFFNSILLAYNFVLYKFNFNQHCNINVKKY